MKKKKAEPKPGKLDWYAKVQEAYDALTAGGETERRRARSILSELLLERHEQWQSDTDVEADDE